MISDIRKLANGAVIDADLCIIGGGPAAIAIARELSGTKLEVCILESGGLGLESAPQAFARGTSSGIPYFALEESRYRMLGGSTYRVGERDRRRCLRSISSGVRGYDIAVGRSRMMTWSRTTILPQSELGFIQKLRLLVGHPGHAIAIVLASVILFTGIGSFYSARMFSKGFLTFRRAAICAAVSIMLADPAGVFDAGSRWVSQASEAHRSLCHSSRARIPDGSIVSARIFPLMHSERLIPLSMGVNALTGTIASGLGVALAPIIGFRAVILLGVAIYIIVALMPHHVRQSIDQRAAVEIS